jgi:serine/threonine protein phosphatase PrpC
MGLTDAAAIYVDTSLEEPRLHTLKRGTAAVYTHRGPHKETANEDAVAVISTPDGATVLAVADGLGGMPSGDLASALTIQSLAASVQNAKNNSLREAILDGIELANRKILTLGTGAATTLAVVEVRDDILRTYHVGDAGVLITGQRGRRHLQTVPHSPTGYAVEAGVINETEALNHEQRNLVSNVVGSHDLRIEIGSLFRLSPRDTVVVASDGLFDNLLSEEIIEYVRCGRLSQAAYALVLESKSRMEGHNSENVGGYPDDISFILYRPCVAIKS